MSRAALVGLAMAPTGTEVDLTGIDVVGDVGHLQRLLASLQPPDPSFPILTPAAAG